MINVKKFEKLGISIQIIFVISLVSMIGILAISYTGYVSNVKEMRIEINNKIQNTVNNDKHNIDLLLSKIDNSIKITAKMYKKNVADINKTEKSFLNNYLEDNMYILLQNGELIGNFNKDSNSNITYLYNEAIEANKIVISHPYKKNDNTEVVSAGLKIVDSKDEIIGVLFVDIKLEDLLNKIENSRYDNTGYKYLIDKSGTIIAHPEKEFLYLNIYKLNNNDLDSFLNSKEMDKKTFYKMSDYLKNNNKGQYSYIKNKQEHMVYFEKLPEVDWKIVTVLPKDIVFHKIAVLKRKYISLIFIDLLLTLLFIGVYSSKRIVFPIRRASFLLDKLANKDFSDSINKEKLINREDEIGVLFKSMKLMQNNLKQLVSEIAIKSKEINELSNQIDKATIALKEDSNKSVDATHELLTGIEQTSASVEEINASALGIKESVNDFSNKAIDTVKIAEDINNKATKAKKDAIQAKKDSIDLYEKTKEKVAQFMVNVKSVEKINMLSTAIMEITNQTNLLSLNASIESARAGEAGKGFAVVADEIRKLANQSKNTVVKIQEIVPIIQGSVFNLSDSCEELLCFIDNKIIKDYDTFANVGESYNKDTTMFKNILIEFNSKTGELDESLDSIVEALKEINTTVSNSSSETNNINKQNFKINEKINEIKSQIEFNRNNAEHLKTLINQFKIK